MRARALGDRPPSALSRSERDDRHARQLFIPAALFNWSVVFALLFLRPMVSPLLNLTPATGTNLSFLYLASALIGTFGFAYVCAALDHRKYRSYIELGTIGKLLVVVAVGLPWLQGITSWQLPTLASGDLIFATLFLHFQRRTLVDS